MKKLLVPVLLILTLVIAACGNTEKKTTQHLVRKTK